MYLTHQRHQFSAKSWSPDSFRSGEIKGKARVKLGFNFPSKYLSKYHRQDRIVLKVHSIVTGDVIELEQKLKNLKKECFFITFGFGRQSQAYHQMIQFRDTVLQSSVAGRIFIAIYYTVSRSSVGWISRVPYASKLLTPFLRVIVLLCGSWLRYRQNQE